MGLLAFFNKQKREIPYKSIFKNEHCYNMIEEKLKFIDKSLLNYREEIVDSFCAIYKESNLSLDEFLNRLDNRLEKIYIGWAKGEIDGAYSDYEKSLILHEKLFQKGPAYDIVGNIKLNEEENKLYNEYRIIRTLIHEGLHCIANNDLIKENLTDSRNSLVILDELKTVQIEQAIYEKYFHRIFEKGEKISNKYVHQLEYFGDLQILDEKEYYSVPKANFKGYPIVNTYANIVDYIDKDFNDIYWGKKSFLGSNLDNDLFEDFSKKAMSLSESYGGHRLNTKMFYEFEEAFYKCIDKQVKDGNLNEEAYLDLKEVILNNSFNFPSKHTNKNVDIDSLNFDAYFLRKLELENPGLDINEPLNNNLIKIIESHFSQNSFEPNISSQNKISLEI